MLFGGQKVKKGTYALYVIPQEKEWKIILNRGVNNWGAYTYDAKEDVATTTVPVKMMNEKMERFTINFEDITDEKLNLVFEWDKTRADVPVEILNVEENATDYRQSESHQKNRKRHQKEKRTEKVIFGRVLFLPTLKTLLEIFLKAFFHPPKKGRSSCSRFFNFFSKKIKRAPTIHFALAQIQQNFK